VDANDVAIAVLCVGDMDGDGLSDILVGGQGDDGGEDAGAARLISSASWRIAAGDGKPLRVARWVGQGAWTMHLLPTLAFLACITDPDGPDDTGADTSDTGSNTDTDSGDTDAYVPDCSAGSGLDDGQFEFFAVDGVSAWLFAPPDLPPCANLFVFLHGGNSPGGTNGDGFWNDMGTELPLQAGPNHYALLVPGLEDAPSSNHPWSYDQVDTLDGMIDQAHARLDLDRGRALVAGTSAGGVMAGYYGLYQPGKQSHMVVASAGFGGGQYDYPPEEPDPKLPFYVAHDPDDDVAPYYLSEDFVEELLSHGHDVTFEDFEGSGGGHMWSPTLTQQVLDWWLGGDTGG
jgi:hypothetical protein